MTHHRRGLRRLLRDDDLEARIAADFRSAGLDRRRLAMLEYARKLTDSPAAMQRDDVESLREVGFTDEDVLGIAEAVGYYAYANRVVQGLGVELES